jgi:hypothetical protein
MAFRFRPVFLKRLLVSALFVSAIQNFVTTFKLVFFSKVAILNPLSATGCIRLANFFVLAPKVICVCLVLVLIILKLTNNCVDYIVVLLPIFLPNLSNSKSLGSHSSILFPSISTM